MQASDRFNINSQLEHLQAKYVGTGHADLNRFEWAVNIQRDSFASYIGHYPMLAYFAIAENESIGRERYNFMQIYTFACAYRLLISKFGSTLLLAILYYGVNYAVWLVYEVVACLVSLSWPAHKMLLPCGLPPEREDD
ncbi:hypothetical protein JRO89_XS03G0093600 [Xanthoceras sorbifolium]|uniref:Splicing factor 3B subunit 5 n=1 Tax=Xanthoceras sorbifolium TaxID=99658 RepID=A0ABQ8I9A8_9ROSI|nr:hypothetical protein JRO89_XS03G0093600 [Xanthoceras sorbifolium]